MSWKPFVQYAIAMALFLYAVLGAPGILDDVQTWRRWLEMLDECGARIAVALVGVLLLISPEIYFRFKKRRAEKLKSERLRHMFYLDATALVDSYIKEAIADSPDWIKPGIRYSILKDFEERCPDGMKGDGVYDGYALDHWIRESAIELFIAHRGKLWTPSPE